MAVKFRTNNRVKLTEVLDTDRRDKIRDEAQRGMSIKDYYPKIHLNKVLNCLQKE